MSQTTLNAPPAHLAPSSAASAAPGPAPGVTRHANDKGVEQLLGIGKGNKRLNTNHQHLQEELEQVRDDYLAIESAYTGGGVRYDYMAKGLLGEIVARTPIFIYDLPELQQHVSTAFVDRSGKMYINAPFFQDLLAEHKAGLTSLDLLIDHEADHLRRMHLSRMLDLDHTIANIAQDIRINIDITRANAAKRITDRNGGKDPLPSELEQEIAKYLGELASANSAIMIGYAMTPEDHKKYAGMSEESIAAELLKNWKEPPKIPNTKIPFETICEGAAQDADACKAIVKAGSTPGGKDLSMTPADLSGLAQDLRAIGKARANPTKVSDQQIQDVIDGLEKLLQHIALKEHDTAHRIAVAAIQGTGAVHTSANTGEPYLDGLAPKERVQLALQVLKMALAPANPGQGQSQDPKGGVQVTDLERMLSGSGPRNPGTDKGSVPHPNTQQDANHVMDTEELVKILEGAGVAKDTLEKLGYDSNEAMQKDAEDCKNGIVSAINKATEDKARLGGAYPGGHMVDHARAQMTEFFKPVVSWTMSVRKIIEGSGRGQRYDHFEPWSIYSANASDMGFSSQDDVPYMGSSVPGKEQRPLVLYIVDTSGSVDDNMLTRLFSEGINMARRSGRSTAPEVVIMSADTVMRGQPVKITEKNYKDFLKGGLNYGGRGGTNLQAGIECAFKLVAPGSISGFAKRKIDAVVYASDLEDSPPDTKVLLTTARACGMKKLPTTLFLAPKKCFSERFNKGVAQWADVVYYGGADTVTKVNLDALGANQARRSRSVTM